MMLLTEIGSALINKTWLSGTGVHAKKTECVQYREEMAEMQGKADGFTGEKKASGFAEGRIPGGDRAPSDPKK